MMFPTDEEDFFQKKMLCSIFTAIGTSLGLGTSAGAGAASLGGGLLSGISSLFGSGKSSSASSKAAGTSAFVSELELLNSQQQAATARQYQQPFVTAGYGALPQLTTTAGQTWGLPYLNNAANYLQQAAGMTPPSVVTENWLQQTPGYQWQLGQGLNAVQASAAARGLGVSGSSLKGAATYATGLADSNYQSQFNNAQTAYQDVINQGYGQVNLANTAQNMQQQAYNQYANIANLGQSAASGAAQAGTTQATQANQALSTGAQQYGTYTTQAGQAQAAGTTGASNALTSGVNNYLSYNALQSALQGGFSQSTSGGIYGTDIQTSPSNVTTWVNR